MIVRWKQFDPFPNNGANGTTDKHVNVLNMTQKCRVRVAVERDVGMRESQ